MKSAVTVSLVSEARGGPFVFWDGLESACREAARIGFDAIEVFPPAPDAPELATLRTLLDRYGLRLAALGTGAGWVRERLSLTDPNPDVREKAVSFIRAMIDAGAAFGAPAIIGSMQGRWGGSISRESARGWLSESLETLGAYARSNGTILLYEPLNRYETNMANTVADGVTLLRSLSTDGVRLLADLFHMNIEEKEITAAFLDGGDFIGHVHFVDSNRRPAGEGHIDYAPIIAALRDISYVGYLSAEALPYPDSIAAAERTAAMFRKFTQFPRSAAGDTSAS